MSDFTHFNKQGEAVMVDVSEKKDTVREATASGRIRMSEECYLKVKNDDMKKVSRVLPESWALRRLPS